MSTSQLPLSLFGEPRPNELLWGWLGRFRERYDGLSHDALGEILGELPSYRKGFPTRLEHFAGIAGKTPDELLADHTLYKYAAMELSATDADALRTSMLTSNTPVQIPKRFMPRSDATLRVCLRCIEKDIKMIGCTYYRCNHQISEVMECDEHRVPLFATKVPIGERAYVPPQVAAAKGNALQPYGYAPQLVANAYAFFARKKVYTRDHLAPILEQVLATRGFLKEGRVSHKLHSFVERAHGGRWLFRFDFYHHDNVQNWTTVPQLALTLSALTIDWDDFLAEADLVEQANQVRIPLTAYQQELLDRIRVDAPKDARNLRRSGAKVTVWSLATALSNRYGMNLASNYAWRPEFRAVLLAHTKSF